MGSQTFAHFFISVKKSFFTDFLASLIYHEIKVNQLSLISGQYTHWTHSCVNELNHNFNGWQME